MRTKAPFVLAAIAVATVAAAANWSAYTVANRAHSAHLVWNDEDAYIFIATSRLGWQWNLLTFAGERIAAWLGTFGSPPTDQQRGTVVVKFGRTGVERFDHLTLEGKAYALIDDRIYVSTPKGVFRWEGSGFVDTSTAEREGFTYRSTLRASFQNENGWSGHTYILSRAPGGTPFEVDVGGERWTVVVHYVPGAGSHAIDLQRGDAPAERVWELAEDRRDVTEREFNALLNADGPSEPSGDTK